MAKSILSFALVLLIIAGLCFTAVCGLDLGFAHIPSVLDEENGIRRGLDLVGGSVITFEAQIPEGTDEASVAAGMDVAVDMLRTRLDNLGDYEGNLYVSGTHRITVEIPNVKNPEEAVQKLGSTAILQFCDADGNVVMDGSDIEGASAQYGQLSGYAVPQNYVELQIKKDSVSKFAEATKAAANRSADNKNYIMIVLDGQVMSMPFVDAKYAQTGISSEKVQITGNNYSAEDTGWLANIINAGQLPFTLKDIELRSVGPQLGERALETSLFAGLIGICLVMIFMICYYRLPGVVASFSLVFYVAAMAIVLALIKANLTLPGVAGIVLSIGMAVDANVVIFERIKEELRAGKVLRSAIDSGFNRAFTAILDSNITTFIAAVVLYIFGTGTIKGFAITLGLGIVLSMFTAVTLTRFLLNRLVDFKISNIKAYGA